MFSDIKLDPLVCRKVVLGLMVIAVTVSGMLIYSQQAEKKLSPVASSKPAQDTKMYAIDKVELEQQNQNESNTAVSNIVDADSTIQVEQSQPKTNVVRVRSKHKLRSSAHNSLAMRFPGIPRDLPKTQKNGVVEMWYGDKETFVSVPPGSKFED